MIVVDFNPPVTTMGRSSRQENYKETTAQNDTLDLMDLTHIFRTFHPKAEYTFFSSVRETFPKKDHIMHQVISGKYIVSPGKVNGVIAETSAILWSQGCQTRYHHGNRAP